MPKQDSKLDVLVVYDNEAAHSAANLSYQGSTPFAKDTKEANYNLPYAYFLKTCRDANLRAAFTTVSDIVGPGTCKSYWIYQRNIWKKVRITAKASQVFTKFSPRGIKNSRQWERLFSSKTIRPLNQKSLRVLFCDKLTTYQQLQAFSIPTVELTQTTLHGIEQDIATLRERIAAHPHQQDFSPTIIVKDRFGAAGQDIYKFTENYAEQIQALTQSHPSVSFILQPLVHFEKGYTYKNSTAPTDIRLIFQNGEIIQTYIRRAKANDFRCNEHQGGKLTYVELSDIPESVLAHALHITKQLGSKSALYALDFIISNEGNVYLLEGNISPGIDWDTKSKKNELKSKELIHHIVQELARRGKQLVPKSPQGPLVNTLGLPNAKNLLLDSDPQAQKVLNRSEGESRSPEPLFL